MKQLMLTSCMTGPDAILAAPATELRDIILEGLAISAATPEIFQLICGDVDLAAKKEKAGRLADQRWLEKTTPALFEDGSGDDPEIAPGKLSLQTGRARLLDDEAIFVLYLCRGHLHSTTTPNAMDRLSDSVLIGEYLAARGMRLPARTTLWSYLAAISPATRASIDLATVRHILGEGLDDMSQVAIDSFSVKADSAWPTDSGLLPKLLGRAFLVGNRMMERFGIRGFTGGCVPGWLKQLKSLDFSISCNCGKPNSRSTTEKLYLEVLEIATKIVERLARQLETLEPVWSGGDFMPSRQARFEQECGTVFDCLGQAVFLCEHARERICEGKSRPAAEKVLSVSDRTAAYIKKGAREAVVGYKPQVLRTGNGFITVAELLPGNPADSGRLLPVVTSHIDQAGVVPSRVTGDDGYSCAATRNMLIRMGIEVVSISGSKGRKITSDEEWDSEPYVQARSARSAVESVIWVLRHNGGLYRFSRRGLDAVRAELQERVLAYNLSRCALVRRRKAAATSCMAAA
ncbi:MAG: transposase [Victivallales bacterium]|nr:transposase [Victivallales bacterium]MBT7300884.1 transposase [Victivallales bacterium]